MFSRNLGSIKQWSSKHIVGPGYDFLSDHNDRISKEAAATTTKPIKNIIGIAA